MTTTERNTIVENNLKLVWLVINKLNFSAPSRDDQFQEGCIGLMKAVEGFDPSLGYSFSTYATKTIEFYIRQAARKEFDIQAHQISLDAPLMTTKNDDADDCCLYDVIADRVDVENTVINRMIANAIVSKLTPSERQVLTLRFLDGVALEDIAKRLNMTLPALRRFEAQALRHCRQYKSNIEE